MLFGGFDHKIDKKGRVFIPSAFRDELGESFIICRGIYGKKCGISHSYRGNIGGEGVACVFLYDSCNLTL